MDATADKGAGRRAGKTGGRRAGRSADRRPRRPDARQAILGAMQAVLGRDGFAGLTTREVARTAGVPLSQIHYHFGSKQGLFLALLDHLDRRLFERQQGLYAGDAPLSAQWREACDFLDDDIESGYVRLLQEAIALGWSDAAVAERMREHFDRWTGLLTG